MLFLSTEIYTLVALYVRSRKLKHECIAHNERKRKMPYKLKCPHCRSEHLKLTARFTGEYETTLLGDRFDTTEDAEKLTMFRRELGWQFNSTGRIINRNIRVIKCSKCRKRYAKFSDLKKEFLPNTNTKN